MSRRSQTREKRRNPVAPFITSTLQQESSRKLRFSVKRTMMLAQRSYEGKELGKEGAVGLITYMRTDSTRVSNDAITKFGTDRPAFRCELRSGCSKHIQEQERYSGRARSDSSDIGPSHSGECGKLPRGRRVEAVPADLDAICCLANDAGCVRSNDDRSYGEG